MIINENLFGIALTLETNNGLFSPNSVDAGTKAMLSLINLTSDDKLLDLGCGCGIVGIWAAKQIPPEQVTMCDIDPVAIETSRRNLTLNAINGVKVFQSDGLSAVPDSGYSLILSNPPYHTDFAVAKSFIEKGFNRLQVGGKMYMVTKREDWYRNKLTSVFGGCKVYRVDGYFVFEAQKRSTQRAVLKQKKTSKQTQSL